MREGEEGDGVELFSFVEIAENECRYFSLLADDRGDEGDVEEHDELLAVLNKGSLVGRDAFLGTLLPLVLVIIDFGRGLIGFKILG